MDSIIEKEKNKTNNSISSFFFLQPLFGFQKVCLFIFLETESFFFLSFFYFFEGKKKTPHDYLKPILRNLYYYTDPGTEIQDIIFRMELVTI